MSSSKPTRLGGRTGSPSGNVIVWSVADGRQGRRWRESLVGAESLVRTLLVETGPEGAMHRLEIVSAAGLLTLHPDADGGTLHGNIVRPTGVDHLRFDQARDRAVMLDDSPALTAIAIARLGRNLAVGERRWVDVLWIDDLLIPVADRVELSRLASGGIRLSPRHGASDAIEVALDEAGLVQTIDRISWPLEP